MLIAQAHSFAQQARLAVTLSWVAGYTNILTVLTCAQVSSHMSGVASELGRDVVEATWQRAAYAGLLLLVFFVGATISGVLTELGRARGWKSIYVWPVALQAFLLAVFALLVEFRESAAVETGGRHVWMTAIPAMAMGIQNATITRISGGVVRTTHITGVLTDLGLETSQLLGRLAGRPRGPARLEGAGGPSTHASRNRMWLLLSIILAFITGSALGTLAFYHLSELAMLPPVVFLLWIIFMDVISPIAELERTTSVDSHGEAGLPAEIALFRVRMERATRRGRLSPRMPDLLAWAARLSAAVRVVVLDLANVRALDTNGALEIRALHLHLEAQGRGLVLAGVDPELYQKLLNLKVMPEIEPLNVCTDVEIALGRAYVVMEFDLPEPGK